MIPSKKLYQKNKDAKVGTQCKCASCGTEFIKNNYQQAFCKTKNGTICKDKYWNTIDPKKRNNTTRISPASQRWLVSQQANRISKRFEEREYRNQRSYEDDRFVEDDQCWDAHKDSF
jgi:hypothetical protein